MMFENSLGVGQPAGGVDLQLERRSGRRRRLTDLAGRHLDVLLGDGVWTSTAVTPRLASLSGSSQTRIE